MLEAEQLSEQLSALLDDIYEATLDRSLWVDVLRRAAEFVCGRADPQADGLLSAAVHNELSVDPHFTQLQPDQYAKLEPIGSTLLLLENGQVSTTTDVMPHDQCPATRYDSRWAQPQGDVNCMHAILDYQASGLLDDATRLRLRLIEPHLRRALLIGNVIDLWRTEAATLIDVLDGISAAMFLVSAGGRIIDANASGHAMLAQGSLLRAAGGRLAPVDANASPALLRAMAIDGDATVGIKSIPVPLRARDGDRYVAHVRPLTSGARQRVGARCEVAAAVLVHRPETGSAQEVIRKHYQLSPTELRVLLAIAQRDAVHEVAQALGITIPTLKTHLYHVFTKTGAKRRADLVKLVAGYASVLVH